LLHEVDLPAKEGNIFWLILELSENLAKLVDHGVHPLLSR